MPDDKVTCRTPTEGKQPTRIDRWKFDSVRKAILAVTPDSGDGIPFQELPRRVEAQFDAETLGRLGSVMWYTTTVKLELEVRGEIVQVPGKRPQHLIRTT